MYDRRLPVRNRAPTDEEVTEDLKILENSQVYLDDFETLCVNIIKVAIEDYALYEMGDNSIPRSAYLMAKEWLFLGMYDDMYNATGLSNICETLDLDVAKIREMAKRYAKELKEGRQKTRRRLRAEGPKQLDLWEMMI